ncbi:MAG: EAL domain-containing protein [Steroidobacteraceae bacterium]
MLRSFAGMEQDATQQGIQRVRRVLEADLETLDLDAVRSGGEWDEMQHSLQGGTDEQPLVARFASDALETPGVDLVWMAGPTGATVYAAEAEPAAGAQPAAGAGRPTGAGRATEAGHSSSRRIVELAPQELARLSADAARIRAATTARPLERLVRMPRGALEVAFVAIRCASGAGPRRGTLVVGRYLTRAVANRAAAESQLPVAVTLVGGADARRLPQEVRQWLASSPRAAAPFLALRDAKMLNGYALLRDMDGQPLAVLSTGVHRSALELGRERDTELDATVAAGFGCAALGLLWLLGRLSRARAFAERQRRVHRRALERLAHRDALTGLPNRRYLEERLPQLIEEAGRQGALVGLLYVDLDHFRDVNDSLGHSYGDRLLATVARRLRAALGDADLVVRMGGDEFMVVATHLPDASAIDPIARRIEGSLGTPIDVGGVRLEVVASIGVSLYPADGASLAPLLKHAEIALYEAKRRGRGHYQIFTYEMQAQLADRLEMGQALRQAIGTQRLYLEYQPAFDLVAGTPVGFEALTRWNHPRLGLVPPSRFVPIAEQDSLIIELGAWVLREVCRQLCEWRREGLPLLPVSINAAPAQFEHGRLVETLADLTREFDIDAHLLHIEITESAAMQDSDLHLAALQALRRLGSRILIDDFGTGYSSLSYLKRLPIDALKIDRAFVRDMATDPNDAAIVSAIIGIARSLGLNVVAEGVETRAQVDCLVRLGCGTAQGFYFSRPLVPADVRTILRRVGAQHRSAEIAQLRLLQGGLGS